MLQMFCLGIRKRAGTLHGGINDKSRREVWTGKAGQCEDKRQEFALLPEVGQSGMADGSVVPVSPGESQDRSRITYTYYVGQVADAAPAREGGV